MHTLDQRRILITGGSRGLGLGVVEALIAHHANVTVVARGSTRLAELKARLGVSIIPGDATDPMLAESVLREVRPSVLVLNAGIYADDGAAARATWESFSKNWNTDVKATFHWIQSALRLRLERGSRVLISSSGVAIGGSPLSGGYAGAKRMIWMMAGYANGVASDLKPGIRFQALLVRQIVGATELGRAAAEATRSAKA
jgi:NAD(P)-dependent dehydrogenase (short-subunit alcohol dehydrogenase family)